MFIYYIYLVYNIVYSACTQSVLFQMSIANYGVGAEGLLAAQSVLSADSDAIGNDGRVEHLWAMKVRGKMLMFLI